MTELTTTKNKLHLPQTLTPVACGRVYDTGWLPPNQMTYEEWANQGAAFQAMSKLLPWAIGDWLNAGEFAFGEMYTQAIEWTGSDRETLEQYKWVTSRFPPERRWPLSSGLSYSHHRHVAKLPPDEADAWLEAAYKGAWSTRELHQQMQGADIPKVAVIPAKLSKDATPMQARDWITCMFDKAWIRNLILELENEL